MLKSELKKLLENGGATLNKNGEGVNFKNDYQVSKKDCYILPVRFINKILTAVNDLLNDIKTGDFVGLWVDNKKLYIDISERIKSLKKALRVGKARKQISVFCWSSGDCVYC